MMALSKFDIKDPSILRVAILAVLVAGLIVATWHVSWLHRQHRYEMQTAEFGVVYILDKETGTVYFARQGQITEGWTVVWRKAPALPTEK